MCIKCTVVVISVIRRQATEINRNFLKMATEGRQYWKVGYRVAMKVVTFTYTVLYQSDWTTWSMSADCVGTRRCVYMLQHGLEWVMFVQLTTRQCRIGISTAVRGFSAPSIDHAWSRLSVSGILDDNSLQMQCGEMGDKSSSWNKQGRACT